MFELRDYQKAQLNFLQDSLPTSSCCGVESPTGSGKTIVMLELAKWWLENHPLESVCISTGFNNLVFLMEQRAVEMGLDPLVLIGTKALNCPIDWADKYGDERLYKPFTPDGECKCGSKHLHLDTTARTPSERVCPFTNSAYRELLGKIQSGGKVIITNHSTLLAHQEAKTFYGCSLLIIDEAHTFGTYYDSWMSVELDRKDLDAVDKAVQQIKPPMGMIIKKNVQNGKMLPSTQLDALLKHMDRTSAANVNKFFSIKPGLDCFLEHNENHMCISRFYKQFDFVRPKTVLFTATLDVWTSQMFNLRKTNTYRERKQFCDYSQSEFVAMPRENFDQAFHEFLDLVDSKGMKAGLCLSTTIKDMQTALRADGYLGYHMVSNLQQFQKMLEDDPNAKLVLCGSRALFQGVDIKNLQFVCLNRIPFPNWDDKARAMNDYLTDCGRNGFDPWKMFTVPKTQNDMLQSSGRLWRDVDSKGLVSVFDERVERFHYMFNVVFGYYRKGIKMSIIREPNGLQETWK